MVIVKPWGTGHAIYACRELVDGPALVINADDYYGPEGYMAVYDYLTTHEDDEVMKLCMAGYELRNTITENGHVARGVCVTDEQGKLTSITELFLESFRSFSAKGTSVGMPGLMTQTSAH